MCLDDLYINNLCSTMVDQTPRFIYKQPMALKTSYKRSMLCHIMSDISTEFKIIAINSQLLATVSNNSYQTTSSAKIVVNDDIITH